MVESSCLNCGHTLHGPFCSQCRQEAVPPVPRLNDLAREVLDEVFKVDSKVLTSLKTLVTRPGQLTAEYAAGRRASYVTPFKLYFWSSFLFYVLMSLNGDQNPASWGMEKGNLSPAMAKGLQAGFQYFLDNAATISILMLPLNALALALLFWRRKQHFLLHLVATLHIWSGSVLLYLPFYLLVELIIHLYPTPFLKMALGPSYMLFIYGYQWAAFRRLFRASIAEATFKAAAVSVWTAMLSFTAGVAIMGTFVFQAIREDIDAAKKRAQAAASESKSARTDPAAGRSRKLAPSDSRNPD